MAHTNIKRDRTPRPAPPVDHTYKVGQRLKLECSWGVLPVQVVGQKDGRYFVRTSFWGLPPHVFAWRIEKLSSDDGPHLTLTPPT